MTTINLVRKVKTTKLNHSCDELFEEQTNRIKERRYYIDGEIVERKEYIARLKEQRQ